jgi:hypothetical protein
MELKQIIFNSFPRSGNVYLAAISSQLFLAMRETTVITVVHMPEVYSADEIINVAIFRKPEDCISSIIYKNTEGDIDNEAIELTALKECNQYKKYIKYAKASHEKIYIAKFDEIIEDSLTHLVNIGKIFDSPFIENYEEKFNSINRNGKMWTDKYHGHYPREKDDNRKNIENVVGSLDFIKEINQEYEDFILKYKTAIR